MAKLTLTDGTIFEGTTEELIALTEQFSGKVADPVAGNITHNGVEYTLVNRKAREGDVVILRDTDGEIFKIGKVYEVLEDVRIADSDGALYYLYRPKMRRTLETVHVYEPKAETLKVGDYAVVSGSSIFDVDLDGKVGTYRGPSENIPSRYARVEVLNEKEYLVMHENLRKATDAEVAEAKASAEQSAKDAVFTQVGRKPNEYREGDIVRYIGDASVNGMYADVVSDTFEGITRIEFHRKATLGKCSEKHDTLEPIVFVESRLDLRK